MSSTKVLLAGGIILGVVLLGGSFNLVAPSSLPAQSRSSRSASAAAEGCPRANPPLSIEWTGRETMTVSVSSAVSVEVQKHDFPGCVHQDDFWGKVDAQEYEPATLRVIEAVLTRAPRSTFVDLGAYVGPTTLFGAHFAAAVLAVEADPQSFSTLNANVRLNPRVESKTRLVFGCAAGDAKAADFVGSGEPNSRRADGLAHDGLRGGGRWSSACRTVPALLEEQGLDAAAVALVNMDIVGSELWALPGLKPLLAARGAKKPAVLLHVYAPLWKDASDAAVQKAWDVVSSFAFVYDENLSRVERGAKPAFCESLGCTMLLTDAEFK